MSIKSVNPLKTVVSIGEGIHRTYTSTWQVIATHDEGPLAIAAANPIPEYGAYYTWGPGVFDTWAFVKSIDTDRQDDTIEHADGTECYVWTVTVVHDSKPDNEQPASRRNPLNDPPVIKGSFSPYTRSVYRDAADAPIANTAKFPLYPGIERSDAYDTISIAFNTASINLGFRAQHRGVVNSNAMWGLNPRQIKLMAWEWSPKKAGRNFRYIRHQFEFLISYEEHPKTRVAIGPSGAVGWYTTQKNQGFEYYEWGRDGSTAGAPSPLPPLALRRRVFTDGAGVELTEQQLLAPNGDKLPEGDDPYWVVTKDEKEKNFLLIPGMPTNLLI